MTLCKYRLAGCRLVCITAGPTLTLQLFVREEGGRERGERLGRRLGVGIYICRRERGGEGGKEKESYFSQLIQNQLLYSIKSRIIQL